MSIYDKASLVLIPSGTKTSKVYSQKPVNGDGDFTFSRSTAATRVNADGNIEKETQNLLTYSNDFNNWSKALCNVTSGQSGYDGSSDAWLLTATGSGNSCRRDVVYSGVNSFSVYAKAGTADGIRLRFDASTDRNLKVDLTDGSLISDETNLAYSIEDVSGGWYRITATSNLTTGINVRLIVTDNTGTQSTGSVYIQDAQLEQGLVARDYIETTTAAVEGGITDNVPRLDYTDSSCPSLKLEPQRTNIHTNSEYVDAYVKSRSTITNNATTSPEGVSNASKVIPLSTSNGWSGVNAPNYSFTSGDTYTLSVFAKAGEYDYCQVGGSTPAFNGSFATINLTNGVVEHQSGITATTEDYGSGWYRISFTHTAIATASSPIGFFAVYSTAVSSRLATQVGDDVSGVYMYGWMAEQGSYPTSYIPTYGTSATRAKDSSEATGLGSSLGSTEGTIFLEVSALTNDLSERRFALSNGTTGNVARVGFTNVSNRILAVLYNGSNQCVLTYAGADITQTNKIAFTYAANDFALYVNGESRSTDTFGSTFTAGTLTEVHFNEGDGNGNESFGNFKQVVIFPTRLSNEELATLTTI